jgi:hypothetical protein
MIGIGVGRDFLLGVGIDDFDFGGVPLAIASLRCGYANFNARL